MFLFNANLKLKAMGNSALQGKLISQGTNAVCLLIISVLIT